MNKQSLAFLLFSLSLLGSCTFSSGTEENALPPRPVYANEDTEITLQDQVSRIIVKCYSNAYEPAESCARFFEAQNYTRLRNIPYKTANYDFLKPGSYPTRRWRPGERTPRW